MEFIICPIAVNFDCSKRRCSFFLRFSVSAATACSRLRLSSSSCAVFAISSFSRRIPEVLFSRTPRTVSTSPWLLKRGIPVKVVRICPEEEWISSSFIITKLFIISASLSVELKTGRLGYSSRSSSSVFPRADDAGIFSIPAIASFQRENL